MQGGDSVIERERKREKEEIRYHRLLHIEGGGGKTAGLVVSSSGSTFKQFKIF